MEITKEDVKKVFEFQPYDITRLKLYLEETKELFGIEFVKEIFPLVQFEGDFDIDKFRDILKLVGEAFNLKFLTQMVPQVEKKGNNQPDIFDAARNLDLEILKEIEKSENLKQILSQKNEDSDIPLFVALKSKAQKDQLAFVTELIKLYEENNINPNITDKDGNTALHLAYMTNYSDLLNIVKYFEIDESIKNKEGKTAAELSSNNKPSTKAEESSSTKRLSTKSIMVLHSAGSVQPE